MKRLLSVVLSALMIFASLATVFAVQSATSVEVKANSDNAYIQEITVIVPTSVSGTMTLQITNKAAVPTELYAMSDTNVYEDVDGVRKYYASVVMPERAVTGSYYLWVGNNVQKDYYEINYTSLNDKIEFYNGLINAINTSADEVGSYLVAPTTKCTAEPADLTSYKDLSDAVKGKVNTMLVNMQKDTETENDLTSIVGTETLSAKNVATGKNDTVFKSTFSAIIPLAIIADASSAEWNDIVTKAKNGEGAVTFDGKYYTAPEGETPLLGDGEIYSYFMKEIASFETLDATELSLAFDKATLLRIADTKNYTYVKDAFLYYEAKSSIVPTMTNITALVNAGKDTDLWKDLKVSGYTDAATLVDNAVNIAQTMVNNGVLNVPSIGGGGGGAGGSSTIDKPSNPGASMGIVSDTTITPADPVNPTQPEPVKGFTDLAQAEWSREAVEYLEKAGVISGKSANSFAPNDAVTREEGAKIIVAAFGLLGDAECDFADVSKDRWSYAYIAAAVKHGIINGYGESFGATDTMTREQAATIIYRAAEKISLEISGEKSEFTDGEHASDWSRDAIAHLAADGVIKGMGDGTFAPKATLTRAQLAQLVYNVLVTIGGVN